MDDAKDPTPATLAANAEAAATLPWEDRDDVEAARRGFLAGPAEPVIRGPHGRVVWDMGAYAFVEEAGDEAPDTVNPSLWRHVRLNTAPGLFAVADDVFQVRGFDISNVTFVEGREGVVVVDPLVSTECAAAALALYRAHRGPRPVTAVVYSHSHVDHFGGVRGVLDDGAEVPVWAPEGFLEHAVAENVLAGPAMARRSAYMFGSFLERGVRGQVDAGVGKSTSTGTVTLIPPTHEVTATGQEEELDGVRFVFQLVPETEAPAELNFQLPERGALYVAEIASHTLHNVLTPRGALVRDALAWAKYLNETIELFAASSDVVFHGHHWPTWGREGIDELLRRHRDLYRFIHDQTLRLMNRGRTATEIAAELELPEALARSWSCRPYYGTVGFNVRAVVQRYLGAYDGNPAHLDPLPPEEAATRYVAAMGGPGRVLEQARAAFADGEFRWAVELANHLVFADPADRAARELEADALEQLAYQAESAVWRNELLAGALELRRGVQAGRGVESVGGDLVRSLPVQMLFDAMGARLDGPRAGAARIVVAWVFTDLDERWVTTLEHGALSTVHGRGADDADATVTLTRAAFDHLILRDPAAQEDFAAGRIAVAGNGERLGELLGLFERPDPGFELIAP